MSNKPPIEVPQGAIRLNTDSQKLEFFAQDRWYEMATDSPLLADSGDTGLGARGVFGTGTTPGTTDFIGFINIASTGNEQDFGNAVTQHQGASAGLSSRTRGIFAGGQNPVGNQIHFVTIAQKGDSIDFGDLTRASRFGMGSSNQTRGIIAGGMDAPNDARVNTSEFVTIASTGDALDFGDLSVARGQAAGVSNGTRGIHSCGQSPTKVNTIDFFMIATLGNAQDFGDSTTQTDSQASGCNAIRGIFAGGAPAGDDDQQVIQFIIMATLGNAQDFGDLSVPRTSAGGVSSPTRSVFAGGYGNPAGNNLTTIDYIHNMTGGNAIDFGDQSVNRDQMGSFSNAHGGL